MRSLISSSTLTGLRLRLAFGRSAVALLAAAAVTALSPGAFANPPGNEPRPNFEVHWGVFTNPMELRWGSRTDWANRVDFAGAPIATDTIVLYEHNFVLEARSDGIAVMRTDPDFWTRVRSRLQSLLATRSLASSPASASGEDDPSVPFATTGHASLVWQSFGFASAADALCFVSRTLNEREIADSIAR